MDGKKFWSMQFFALGILVIVFLLGLRGDLFYLFCLPSLTFLLTGLCLQTALIPLSKTVFDKLVARNSPPPRVMWLIPMVSFAFQLGFMLLLLIGPHLASWNDFWAETLSLPTRVIARLAVDAFILLALATIVQFFTIVLHALHSFNHNGLSHVLHTRDLATSMALIGGSLIVFLLLIHWQLGIPDNLLFCRGLVALNFENNPRRALTLFEELVEKYPKSHLVDTTLLRAGRVHQEILGNKNAARRLYDQLEETCTKSPWRDDAAYRKIMLLLDDKDLSTHSINHLESFIVDYSSSCYADDALCNLVRLHKELGQIDKAKEALGRLEKSYPWGRMFFPGKANYPFNVRNTVAVAREILSVDVHRVHAGND